MRKSTSGSEPVFNSENGADRVQSKADLHHVQSLHVGSAFSLQNTYSLRILLGRASAIDLIH